MSGRASARGTDPELTVVIPTKDRRPVLMETLERLGRFASDQPIDVVVVDDGSRDGTPAAAETFAAAAPWPVRVLRQAHAGPATARNRAIAAATGAACLFVGDDSLPGPRLIERHVAFHRTHPDDGAALLGLVVPAPPLDSSPLQVWLHRHGAQFGYAALAPGRPAPPSSFWTSNVSAKRALLDQVGGFDEGFRGAACEDAELGFRLARAGMTLHYDPEAVAEHFHPTTLPDVLRRMTTIGVAYRRLRELAPEMPEPSRPSARHRLKATVLAGLMRLRPSQSVREASWRFLCDEVLRETYWGAERRDGFPRIGGALARIAAAEPEARPEPPAAPA